ncbi:MAG: ATP-binding protein, partial [Candidatus Pacearchaeota archaeon]|nr:ATP-binding protein [Candidatus Pacearchaeota archaeon]
SLEQAVSDLVDNSINAEAGNVLIRFITKDNLVHSFVIADDGSGMDGKRIDEAMTFGSDQEAGVRSLGKYGMGLKLASLSHAKSLTVISRKNGKCHARRWTIGGIQKDWECEVLDSKEAQRKMDASWAGLNMKKSGTLVIWDDIDKLTISSSGL